MVAVWALMFGLTGADCAGVEIGGVRIDAVNVQKIGSRTIGEGGESSPRRPRFCARFEESHEYVYGTADMITHDSAAKTLKLWGHVELVVPGELRAKLETATIQLDSGELSLRRGR